MFNQPARLMLIFPSLHKVRWTRFWLLGHSSIVEVQDIPFFRVFCVECAGRLLNPTQCVKGCVCKFMGISQKEEKALKQLVFSGISQNDQKQSYLCKDKD